MNTYDRLKELNITLPPAPPAMGLYTPVKIAGNLVFVSGQGPLTDGKLTCTGKVGKEVSIEQAQTAAREIAINTLALLHEYVGDLNRIKSVVKVLGFVASAEGFNKQPEVINAFSQVMTDVFGEKHARSAVGANELPLNISVEIESIFELK